MRVVLSANTKSEYILRTIATVTNLILAILVLRRTVVMLMYST